MVSALRLSSFLTVGSMLQACVSRTVRGWLAKVLRKSFTRMRNVMGREEKRINISELLRELNQRSGARCEGYKLGLDCTAKLTGDVDPLIHHLDGDPRNNELSNLALLCPKCHASVMERLSETRRKTYAKKVAESLDKSSFYRK